MMKKLSQEGLDTLIPSLCTRCGKCCLTDATMVTAFTDGCPGLRSALVDAGVTRPPILEWFHIAMRLQHATQAAPIGRRGCATSLLDWHEMFWTRHSEAIILFHCV
jgi:hypothetical protein